MAGPVASYLSTQLAAQTAFNVPFGLLSLVNSAINAATATGQFNTTVDCSLFVAEDIANLQIYLDSLGYIVEYAKGSNNKSLLVDWGRFLDIPGTEVVVDQGTSPWIIAGTVDQGAAGTDPWPVSITSFPGAITVNQGTNPWTVDGTVNVGNFPATVAVTQSTSPWVVAGTITANIGTTGGLALDTTLINSSQKSQLVDGTGDVADITTVSSSLTGTEQGLVTNSLIYGKTTGGGGGYVEVKVTPSGALAADVSGSSISVSNFPATQPVSGTVTALQGTSPWVVSGTITISPDVNIHDSAGNALSSTGTSLNVSVTDFPATVAVTQSTSPWVVSGSMAVTNFPATQPVSGTVTALQGTSPWTVDGTVNAAQSGIWTVQQGTPPWSVSVTNFPATQPVSGTVTALQGTSPWVVSGTVITSPNVNVHDGTGVSINSTGSSLNVDVTNTVPVTLTSTTITGNVTVVQPTGTNLHTVIDSGTVAATQSGAWTTGRTWALSGGTDSIAVSNFPATQPVSGTITANQGTPASTANRWPIQITDGTDLAQVTAAGAVQVDGSGVIQPVSGTVAVTQSTSPWVISGTVAGTGNFTVVQPTGTNLHTVLDSGTLTSITNALPAGTNVIGHVIADSGSTTVVTGNVTVVQPTGTNLHTVVDSGTIAATQSGAWTTGRTWTLASGTDSVAAAQSGTWTVQPGNTPNTAPWLVEQRAPGTLTTYSTATLGLVAAATPTDIFTIYGSGTKTVKVTRIEISATQNTAAIRDIVLIKRSATNTGGTSSAPTIAPHDSNNAAATATVLAYIANPAALGASVGTIRTGKMDIPAGNLVGNADRLIWTFGDRPGQAIVLRGTSQGLAVNLNGVTSASNSFDIALEFTEE